MTASFRTPHSALRTPHSALRTPHSALRICLGRWFLVQIKEIVDFEEELASAKN